jgi:hypothetical protein
MKTFLVAAAILIGGSRPAFAAAPAPAPAPAWFDFASGEPDLASPSAIDLRRLNERVAGEHGYVTVRDGHFHLAGSDRPVRFWGVNGPSRHARTPADLAREARILSRYGVNLVRVHGGLYDDQANFDPAEVQRRIAIAEAMKREGIYVLFSIYFPLWLDPKPDHPWLRGYGGKHHPFAALMFNPEFQAHYRDWWRALLLTPSETTGRRLIDEPAVMALEIQNEDSYFFWTFSDENLPPAQRDFLERQFADWLIGRHGSLEKTLAGWNGQSLPGDRPAERRMAFRKLWPMVNEKTARDRDTIAFLLDRQRTFYAEQVRFLRELGYKGLITCSNWTTASAEVLGPLEKYSYTVGDFIDRHGYFGSRARGEGAEWSIRAGHTYRDCSALRFETEDGEPGKVFLHPSMDPHYADLPSMISETTWTRPNRYRSEAPLYYAAYGALQDSDAIVHFAFDGPAWSVKPNFWMQPWTLMSPAMMGQFPAAALIYREGLVHPGDVLADVTLGLDDLLALKGTPLPQDAALDELRLADTKGKSSAGAAPAVIDPLIHYAGRARVTFEEGSTHAHVRDLAPFIDHAAQRVRSTTGELRLDYNRGVLRIDAPSAQGVSGALASTGPVDLHDVRIESPLELGHIVLVALDQKPIAQSERLLLQVMSEEQATGFTTEDADKPGLKRITSIGTDPWQVRSFAGKVRFKGENGAALHVTALDLNGQPAHPVQVGSEGSFTLEPSTVYYLVERHY